MIKCLVMIGKGIDKSRLEVQRKSRELCSKAMAYQGDVLIGNGLAKF